MKTTDDFETHPIGTKKRLEALEDENERLNDPDWRTYIQLTKTWLEKYPPDIFTGVSGDPGPVFVVAVREAIAKLEANG